MIVALQQTSSDHSSRQPTSAALTAAPLAELRSALAARSRNNNLFGGVTVQQMEQMRYQNSPASPAVNQPIMEQRSSPALGGYTLQGPSLHGKDAGGAGQSHSLREDHPSTSARHPPSPSPARSQMHAGSSSMHAPSPARGSQEMHAASARVPGAAGAAAAASSLHQEHLHAQTYTPSAGSSNYSSREGGSGSGAGNSGHGAALSSSAGVGGREAIAGGRPGGGASGSASLLALEADKDRMVERLRGELQQAGRQKAEQAPQNAGMVEQLVRAGMRDKGYQVEVQLLQEQVRACDAKLAMMTDVKTNWSQMKRDAEEKQEQVETLTAQLREMEAALSKANSSAARPSPLRSPNDTDSPTVKTWADSPGREAGGAGGGGGKGGEGALERLGGRDEREHAKLIEGLMRRLRSRDRELGDAQAKITHLQEGMIRNSEVTSGGGV
ncbi:hypothetical protein T484DRAFT_1843442 [Baffinella frigidus]|nr:hypothetical protein T484DRAFT_1843442 [Cryptophyta sp. CCMP2293]